MKGRIPSERQAQIVVWLQEEKTLTIKQLAERFSVSAMTIHRDLDKLERGGEVMKVHGGVTLRSANDLVFASVGQRTAVCAFCGGNIMTRTAFTVVKENGDKLRACCPHCGILLLQQVGDVGSALTPDFLHGRRVNVFQAYFVVGSEVRACCLPSVLCFATAEDAGKFQRGFGGEVLDYDQTAERLKAAHHHGR
jgi:DNA-binding Lrp family transcriptional regulator